MKSLILSCFLIISFSLPALTVMDGEVHYSFSIEELNKFETFAFVTRRESDKGQIVDGWQGIRISDVLSSVNIDNFDQLKFTAYDSYMVVLDAAEIAQEPTLIVLRHNNQTLSTENLRLVIPGKSDRYWVNGLETIETETANELPLPEMLFFGEALIDELPLNNYTFRSQEVIGIDFMEMLERITDIKEGEVLVMGKDGYSRRYDIETYLLDARLIIDDEGFFISSSNIRSGMRIKSICYIQIADRGIVFRDRFSDFGEVKELLEWDTMPNNVINEHSELISTDYDFSHPIWKHSHQLRWER